MRLIINWIAILYTTLQTELQYSEAATQRCSKENTSEWLLLNIITILQITDWIELLTKWNHCVGNYNVQKIQKWGPKNEVFVLLKKQFVLDSIDFSVGRKKSYASV